MFMLTLKACLQENLLFILYTGRWCSQCKKNLTGGENAKNRMLVIIYLALKINLVQLTLELISLNYNRDA